MPEAKPTANLDGGTAPGAVDAFVERRRRVAARHALLHRRDGVIATDPYGKVTSVSTRGPGTDGRDAGANGGPLAHLRLPHLSSTDAHRSQEPGAAEPRHDEIVGLGYHNVLIAQDETERNPRRRGSQLAQPWAGFAPVRATCYILKQTDMDTPSPSICELARRLLAISQTESNPHANAAVLVSNRLRISLTKFVGAEGFASLQRRALALARVEVPSLQEVTIGVDGRLEGLDRLDAQAGNTEGGKGEKAAVAVTAHLLGLFVAFIGESFTLRLVHEAWPELSFGESL